MRTGFTVRGIAATGAALLALTACGGGGDEEDTGAGGETTAEGGDTQTNLYGSDGNMGSALGDSFTDDPGALAGMRGTTRKSALAMTIEYW